MADCKLGGDAKGGEALASIVQEYADRVGAADHVHVEPLVEAARGLSDVAVSRLFRNVLVAARRAGILPPTVTKLSLRDVAASNDLTLCTMLSMYHSLLMSV
jgi:hypothetical protein